MVRGGAIGKVYSQCGIWSVDNLHGNRGCDYVWGRCPMMVTCRVLRVVRDVGKWTLV